MPALDALEEFEKMRRKHFTLRKILSVFRSLILTGIVASLWAYLRPAEGFEQFVLSMICLSICALYIWQERLKKNTENEYLVALEMKHAKTKISALDLGKMNPRALGEWDEILTQEKNALIQRERRHTINHATTMVIPILIMLLTAILAPEGMSLALSNAKRAVSNLSWGASLSIIDGKAKENDPDVVTLSSTFPSEIELIAENLVEIKMAQPFSDVDTPPSVELRKVTEKKEELYQSFQLMPEIINGDDESIQGQEAHNFKVSFTVSESVNLYIPELSSRLLAKINVRQLPYPRVQLRLSNPNIEQPWPDDQPLALQVRAEAENPLRLLRLVIVSGKKKSEELVNNILATDLKEVSTNYELILEPYVESDIAEVEIYAEAVDRSIPKPLLGRSEPIRIKTASAYGRYRQTLETLRDLKNLTDQALQERKGTIEVRAHEIAKTAEKQAENSPFFDGLDRVTINSFTRDVAELTSSQNLEKLSELAERLNQFLFEHEVLDDRERDRDFFVAIRGLSRVVEKAKGERPAAVDKVTERIKNFLNDRERRWRMRVDRLPPGQQPQSWAKIRDQRVFHQYLDKIAALDALGDNKSRSDSLQQLSQASAEYRQWIEDLEKKEDEFRQEMERKRQQGLSSARNQLKELQQRQGEISQSLDHAESRAPDISANWPSVRNKQNSNIGETKQLEAQLRALAPNASERIKLAVESMQMTLDAGGQNNFVESESASDLAGRLLRQAENAAQRAQQNSSQRGSRRRVTGDRYYGQSVVGGDVEFQRDYQVDKRYREYILEEVQKTLSEQEEGQPGNDRRLLEQYLRQVVR